METFGVTLTSCWGAERQRPIKDQIFAPSIVATSSLRIPGKLSPLATIGPHPSVDIGLSERLHVPIAYLSQRDGELFHVQCLH